MISFNGIGTYGKLGNQLFQFAFIYGLHKAKGYDFKIPPHSDLIRCFDIGEEHFGYVPQPQFKEKQFKFDDTFPELYADNLDYFGYFQSEKYFINFKDDLLNILKFRDTRNILPEDGLVSIHVRRGDYIGNPYHPIISMDYINEAKTYFPMKKFIVFSDDIDWCKKNNIGDYYSNMNNHIDLYNMSQCVGAIIANSSFSWWGSYLGVEKTTIAPKKWFGDSLYGYDSVDIYRKDWVII